MRLISIVGTGFVAAKCKCHRSKVEMLLYPPIEWRATLAAARIMSDGELARLKSLHDLDRDRPTVDVAGRLLNLSRRRSSGC